MVIAMKVNLKIINDTAKVSMSGLMVIVTRVVGRMGSFMGMVFKLGLRGSGRVRVITGNIVTA